MAVERSSSSSNIVDVLDRVLDKGIVIDAWVRVSLVGIDLLTVEARVVVASIATYLQYSETVLQRALSSDDAGDASRRVVRRPRRGTVASLTRPSLGVQPAG